MPYRKYTNMYSRLLYTWKRIALNPPPYLASQVNTCKPPQQMEGSVTTCGDPRSTDDVSVINKAFVMFDINSWVESIRQQFCKS